MSRPVLAILGVLALAAGIAIGMAAGAVAGTASRSPAPASQGAAPSPVSTGPAVTTPVPTPAATPSPAATPTLEPTPAPTPTPVATPTPAPTPVLVPAPLTGEPVTEKAANRRVVAVMVDDIWSARPQMGLSEADVVWHAPAEGGIPRYLALYQRDWPTRVGPVRSARLYFVGWAAEWRSVFVHAGGSPQAIRYLGSAKGRGKAVYDADWSPYLYRVSFRSAPSNLYSDRANLRKIPASVGAPAATDQAPAWRFAPGAPLDARPEGGSITVTYRYNQVVYRYHPESNTYRRSVSVEGHQFDVGPDPGTRVAPVNVVVMVVEFVPTGDRKGRLDGNITGSGTAWISSNGITVKGTWTKKSFTSPTRFLGPDGEPVTLAVGQTFIQVVDRGTTVAIEAGNAVP